MAEDAPPSPGGHLPAVPLPLAGSEPASGEPVAEELPWLPPAALAAAHLAHGATWVLLAALGLQGLAVDSFQAFAWVHLAGIGWLSTLSLAILFHVVPGFLDVQVPAERFARFMLAPFWAGGVLLAAGFWLGKPGWLSWAGVLVLAGVAGAGIPLALGILRHRPPRDEAGQPAPLIPAFLLVIGCLLAAAVLGAWMAEGLAGRASGAVLVRVPVPHAVLAIGGWLSLLVFGVSTRTVRRILGAPDGKLHGPASTAFAAGVLLAGLAWLAPRPWDGWVNLAGIALLAAGAVMFGGDTATRIARARGPHLPPRAFIGAGVAYLVAAAGLAIGAAAGLPWGPACVFVAIAGWVGQFVNGHLLHIGVRFMATVAAGPADETPPFRLLSQPLSWAAFCLMQAGVLLGGLGAGLWRSDLLAVAGAAGLAGWLALSVNGVVAWRRAGAGST